MASVNPTVSVITLNISKLDAPVNRDLQMVKKA